MAYISYREVGFTLVKNVKYKNVQVETVNIQCII